MGRPDCLWINICLSEFLRISVNRTDAHSSLNCGFLCPSQDCSLSKEGFPLFCCSCSIPAVSAGPGSFELIGHGWAFRYTRSQQLLMKTTPAGLQVFPQNGLNALPCLPLTQQAVGPGRKPGRDSTGSGILPPPSPPQSLFLAVNSFSSQ